MATVTFDRQETELGCLPPICMRCGSPSICYRQKQFQSSDHKLQTRVIAPLCDKHRNHWFGRGLAMFFTPVALLALGCAFIPYIPKDAIGVVFGYAGAAFLVSCIVAVATHYTSIYAKHITDTTLTLTGVAAEFVVALDAYRNSPQARTPLTTRVVPLLQGEIRLIGAELSGHLPSVCMCCGRPADVWKERKFSYSSNQSAALGGLALVTLGVGWTTWTRSGSVAPRLRAPFCRKHQHHWRRRTVAVGLTFLFLVGLIIIAAVFVPSEQLQWLGSICVVSGIVWYLAAIIAEDTAIHATEVTPSSLTLKRVSSAFITTLALYRHKEVEALQQFDANANRAADCPASPSSDHIQKPHELT